MRTSAGKSKTEREIELVKLKQHMKERSFKLREEQAKLQHARNMRELEKIYDIVKADGKWLMKKMKG